MEASNTNQVLKLTGIENWAVWKFQIEVILKAKGYYSIVTGTTLQPAAGAGRDQWIQKDAEAQEIFVTKIEQGPLTHLLSCTTAKEMMANLKSIYDKESAVSVHLLQEKFYASEFKNDSVSVFLSKLEEIRAKLRQAEEPISDKMLTKKILMSLPRYKHFRSAWDSVPTEKQIIKELTSRLLIEEERVSSNEGVEVALVGTSRNRKEKEKRSCFTCGKEGHLSKFCRNKESRTCHYCKKKGHIAENCILLKNKNNTKKYRKKEEQDNAKWFCRYEYCSRRFKGELLVYGHRCE